MSARDALLDAYRAILLADGQRATTLSAVAARAGVSKGGLLYHFASKEALAEGLIERLDELIAEDAAAMSAAEDGPSRYYIRTSVWTDCDLDRTLVAVAQLAQESHRGAREAMERARRQWLELIRDEVAEEATAQAILLIGDGLYFDAALSGDPGAAREGAVTAAGLLPIVDRLLAAARG
ncbi:TetR/AcrR family transcriptional regulator [Brachybacterium sacelli]|uniref:AcrR family transcriptional regulator n=1 Tax=Brachybacterium sacelli TaxID=173364 RepID=A0ABS4WYA5_9MICO|nr:TetR/AcrR family transcriptional regulator [Brachybacterium sacelli]MBP2381086.1 AcrR family transcriptional regulator [Brachybacterium sacelli]